jgi:hypothetical protein
MCSECAALLGDARNETARRQSRRERRRAKARAKKAIPRPSLALVQEMPPRREMAYRFCEWCGREAGGALLCRTCEGHQVWAIKGIRTARPEPEPEKVCPKCHTPITGENERVVRQRITSGGVTRTITIRQCRACRNTANRECMRRLRAKENA